MTAQWYRDLVIYEVYVRGFLDSNGDGIGDLPGLAEKLPYIHGKMQRPKFAASLEKWRNQTEGRTGYTGLILFASASAGFPPYAVIAALAGVLRVSFTLFLVTGFVGRFLRFWFFAAVLDQVLAWFGR